MIDERREDESSVIWYLLRIGACGENVRSYFTSSQRFQRGDQVIVQTEQGEMLAQVLQFLPEQSTPEELSSTTNQLLRKATSEDLETLRALKFEAEKEFPLWTSRIKQWNVDVDLIDLEWTFKKEHLILYILNERGPESTKLALQATTENLGPIHVVPVTAEGVVKPSEDTGGGCGCGSGGCH